MVTSYGYHKHMSKISSIEIAAQFQGAILWNIQFHETAFLFLSHIKKQAKMPPGISYAEVAAESTTNGATHHSDSDTTETETPKHIQKRGYKLVGKTNIENEPIDKPYCYSISKTPITVERKPYVPGPNDILIDAGTPRATLAASKESPNGTVEGDWAAKHQHQTVRFHQNFFNVEG